MILRDLRLSPVRTVLTSMSMFIGILAVIAASLVGTVGSTFLSATNAQMSGRASTYMVSVDLKSMDELSAHSMQTLAESMSQVTGAVVTPVVTLSDGLNITRNVRSGAPIGDSVIDATLTVASYRDIYVLPMVSGRWFSPPTAQAGLELVVNKAGASAFGGTGSPVAITSRQTQTVTAATVTGVVNDGRSDPRVYINTVSFAFFEPQLWAPASLAVYVHPEHDMGDPSAVTSMVNDMVYDALGGKTSGIQRVDNSTSYDEVLRYLQIAFAICGVLLLLVAALGLMNIGLADVEQRSRELLIRRALGASRGNVMMLVAGSSIVLSAIVAVVAVAVSAVLVMAIPAWLPPDSPIPDPAYPYAAALYALGGSMLTALLSSIAPALKASKLEPAMALR
ncbi:hypothetical protein BG22_03375 [Bifidobacterium sp. UTBIF-78]|nr:hypothetical protein BG22_03375 [Bifidobacterium sp. UTBIF-78]